MDRKTNPPITLVQVKGRKDELTFETREIPGNNEQKEHLGPHNLIGNTLLGRGKWKSVKQDNHDLQRASSLGRDNIILELIWCSRHHCTLLAEGNRQQDVCVSSEIWSPPSNKPLEDGPASDQIPFILHSSTAVLITTDKCPDMHEERFNHGRIIQGPIENQEDWGLVLLASMCINEGTEGTYLTCCCVGGNLSTQSGQRSQMTGPRGCNKLYGNEMSRGRRHKKKHKKGRNKGAADQGVHSSLFPTLFLHPWYTWALGFFPFQPPFHLLVEKGKIPGKIRAKPKIQ
ncbi:hypothetical protein DFH09DRAFT_1080691 [Mycena vulgaris]|nr:hypothetical protein DFH09DRAFT_1080691 [Mycena vulgaris]